MIDKDPTIGDVLIRCKYFGPGEVNVGDPVCVVDVYISDVDKDLQNVSYMKIMMRTGTIVETAVWLEGWECA